MDMRAQTVEKIREVLTTYGDPGSDKGRWMPVYEFVLNKIGPDPKTKAGKKAIQELSLPHAILFNEQKFSDMELLDLLVITVRRFMVQR